MAIIDPPLLGVVTISSGCIVRIAIDFVWQYAYEIDNLKRNQGLQMTRNVLPVYNYCTVG